MNVNLSDKLSQKSAAFANGNIGNSQSLGAVSASGYAACQPQSALLLQMSSSAANSGTKGDISSSRCETPVHPGMVVDGIQFLDV